MDNKILKGIEKFIDILATFVFVAMTIIVFTQVVLRYGFSSNIYWADEFSRYGMIWIAFLGAAIGVKYEEHIRIDFFVNLLPDSAKKVVEVLNKLLCIAFLAFIGIYTITQLEGLMSTLTPSLQIPTGIVYLVIPVASALMIIYLVIQTYQIIKGEKSVDNIDGGQSV